MVEPASRAAARRAGGVPVPTMSDAFALIWRKPSRTPPGCTSASSPRRSRTGATQRPPLSLAATRLARPDALTTVTAAHSGRPVSTHGRNEQSRQYHSNFDGSSGAAGSRMTVRVGLMNLAGDLYVSG